MTIEYLDIIDENDQVLGQDTKENKYKKGFISRNVAIFIVDGEGKLLIGKRSALKKVFPNLYDVSAAGNVKAGEDYLEAAQREVEEELGIDGVDCKLNFLDKKFHIFNANGLITKYMTGLFLGYFTGDVSKIKRNDELIELQRLSLAEVEELLKKDNKQFTSSFGEEFLKVKNVLENKSCFEND